MLIDVDALAGPYEDIPVTKPLADMMDYEASTQPDVTTVSYITLGRALCSDWQACQRPPRIRKPFRLRPWLHSRKRRLITMVANPRAIRWSTRLRKIL